MKGIILAGGAGTRLYPMTQVLSKQLQPIYDKPMIFYPLSLLMLGGIRDILIISTERDTPHIINLLGDGSAYGIKLQYAVQAEPKGLAEAFIIGKDFIGGDDVTLILGDNLFFGEIGFFKSAIEAQVTKANDCRARMFGYYVEDPRRYGVVEVDKSSGRVISIEEKPAEPKSNYAIPGIYVFDKTVSHRAEIQKPSRRGELEITDLLSSYLGEGVLAYQLIGRGVTWLDTGTPEALLEAGQLIASIEKRQGLKVACLHEIALRKGFLNTEEFTRELEKIPSCPYKQYLIRVGEEYNS